MATTHDCTTFGAELVNPALPLAHTANTDAPGHWEARKAALEALRDQLIAEGHRPADAARFALASLDERLEATPPAPAAGFAPVAVAELLDFIVDAVDTARQAAAGSPRWLRAIDAGYDFILQQDTLCYDAAAHSLRVESASEPGKVYESNGDCQCRAHELGNPCWHRAAARLVARAFELRALALGVVERQDVSLASARHYARAQFGHPGTLARADAQALAARITRARAALAA